MGAAGSGAPILSVEIRNQTVVRRFEAQRQCGRAGQSEKRKAIVIRDEQQRRVFQFPASSHVHRSVPDYHVAGCVEHRFAKVRRFHVAVIRIQSQRTCDLGHQKTRKLDELEGQCSAIDRFERIRARDVELLLRTG